MSQFATARSFAPAAACAVLALALAACGEEPAPPAQVQPLVIKPVAEAPQPSVIAIAKPEPAPPANPDKALARVVKNALEAEPRVNGQAIDVTSSAGVVSLWGTVADAGERRKAEEVAVSQPGVKSVRNKLVIVKGS